MKQGFGDAEVIYGFNSAALEIAEFGRRAGRKIIIEQTIARRAVERELLARERDSFPDWEADRGEDRLADEYIARERAEWIEADTIVCGSQFVARGSSLAAGRRTSVPLFPTAWTSRFNGGPGSLRSFARPDRGIDWAPQRRALRSENCPMFERPGPVSHDRQLRPVRCGAIALQDYVEVIGPVPRSHVACHFEWADVFLLPSLCEGSATVTYEALAAGLPVVTTPNAGSVVRDGVDGFLVSIRQHESIAERLHELAVRPELRTWMSTNARERARVHRRRIRRPASQASCRAAK